MCWRDCCEVMMCLLAGLSKCVYPLIIITILNHVASLLRSQKDTTVHETYVLADPSGHNKLTASCGIRNAHAAGRLLRRVREIERQVSFCTWHTGLLGPLGSWRKLPSPADISVNHKALRALRKRRWTAPLKSIMILVRPLIVQTEGACWEGPGGTAVVPCHFFC